MNGKDDLATFAAEQIKKDHYAAIGQVVAEWSGLEAMLDMFCIRIVNVAPAPGLVFMTQISGPMRKMETFEALLKLYRVSFDKKTFKMLCDRVRAFSEQRNRTAHDPWIFEKLSTPTRLEATARKELKHDFIPVTTADVLKLVMHIKKLQNDVHDFGENACKNKWSLPQK